MDNLDAGQHRARCGDSRQVRAECKEEQPRFPRSEASPAPYATRIFCVQRFAVHAAPFFDSTFSFFLSFLGNLRLALSRPLAQTPSPKSPPLLSFTLLLVPCPRQTPCAQHPPLLRGSTRPAPRTLTEARTSRRRSLLECRAARAEGSSLGTRHPKTRWWQGRGPQTGRLPMR